MPRPILPEARIDPAVRERVSQLHRTTLDEVQQAVAQHPVVVIGMAWNPFVRKARKLLNEAGVSHHYLGYGSYLSRWRQRNAIKMWTGWPTMPLVFVEGVLVGGADDLALLLQSGELAVRLKA